MQLAEFQKAYPGDLQAGALEEIRERCAAMAAAATEKAAPTTGRGGRTAAKRGAEPETVLRTVRARRGPMAPPPKFSEAPSAPVAAPEAETASRRGTRSRLGGAAAAEPPAAVEQLPGTCLMPHGEMQGWMEVKAWLLLLPRKLETVCPAIKPHAGLTAGSTAPLPCCRAGHQLARRSSGASSGWQCHVWRPAAADAHAVCGGSGGDARHAAHTEAWRQEQGGACARGSHHHHSRWVAMVACWERWLCRRGRCGLQQTAANMTLLLTQPLPPC